MPGGMGGAGGRLHTGSDISRRNPPSRCMMGGLVPEGAGRWGHGSELQRLGGGGGVRRVGAGQWHQEAGLDGHHRPGRSRTLEKNIMGKKP